MGAASHEIAAVEIERVIDGVELIAAPIARVERIVSRRPVGPRAGLAIHKTCPQVGDGISAQSLAVGPQRGIGRIAPSQANADLELVGPWSNAALQLGAGQNRWQAAGPGEKTQDPPSRGGEERPPRFHGTATLTPGSKFRFCSEIRLLTTSSCSRGNRVFRRLSFGTTRILLLLALGAAPLRNHVSSEGICRAGLALIWKGMSSQPRLSEIRSRGLTSTLIENIPIKIIG